PAPPGSELMGDDNPDAKEFRSRVQKRLELGVDPSKDLCRGNQLSGYGQRVADAARFIAGLELATLDTARMVDEQLVTFAQSTAGLDAAMDEAGRYMHGRRWKMSSRAPTLGIAVKGGASSGTYSAGATWRVLTLLQRYAEYKDSLPAGDPALAQGISAKEARFALASGTSAGAIVAAVVDLFHQDVCPIDPKATQFREAFKKDVHNDMASGTACKEYARRLMATVFTCTNQDSLYCIDRQPLWNLASDQLGLMDFRGLRLLMDRHIKEPSLVNSSELVVTTVDFRWGELYIQSDQDPSTIPLDAQAPYGTPEARLFMRRNIEASFVLPFIAHPVDELWVGGERRRGVFLDGGIKSEIPLLALGQRGVDHALVIGSGPTKITPTAPQPNAALIAARYLDLSLSAVTEGEWNAMVPYARYVESKEREACEQILGLGAQRTPQQDFFCKGDYARACSGRDAPSRRFETLGIFRPESVDPSFGYSFDQVQMRRLFNAGAETIRGRCEEVASFLGMRGVKPELLDAWCNESPIAEEELCALGGARADRCGD
ncbi:MAG: patatin-like phospholipase family protein, partial [Myxococcales bacterium]|nr:patatin-like phospholipase family protein [Myxococcales bacterium]